MHRADCATNRAANGAAHPASCGAALLHAARRVEQKKQRESETSAVTVLSLLLSILSIDKIRYREIIYL